MERPQFCWQRMVPPFLFGKLTRSFPLSCHVKDGTHTKNKMAWSVIVNHDTTWEGEVREDEHRVYVFLVSSQRIGRKIVESIARDIFGSHAQEAPNFGPGTIFKQHNTRSMLSARIRYVEDVVMKTSSEMVRLL